MKPPPRSSFQLAYFGSTTLLQWLQFKPSTRILSKSRVHSDIVRFLLFFAKSYYRALLQLFSAGFGAGLGQGWMTVVAAELFGIAGIGQRMIEASGLLASEVVILYMFSIALLYGVSDYVFVLVQDRMLKWQR